MSPIKHAPGVLCLLSPLTNKNSPLAGKIVTLVARCPTPPDVPAHLRIAHSPWWDFTPALKGARRMYTRGPEICLIPISDPNCLKDEVKEKLHEPA